MSSINTTFQPITETLVVDNTAARQLTGASQRCSTFRVVARVASGYLAWGRASTVVAPAAPVAVGLQAGTQNGGVLGVVLGVPLYIEVPADSFFIGSAAFAAGNFEITGGQGGVGG